MPFAPVGPSEPVRCSGLVVCDGGALRRKRERGKKKISGLEPAEQHVGKSMTVLT